MSLRRQLVGSFSKLGMVHIGSIPLTLAISIILARSLGAKEFGQYSFVIALVTIIALPVTAGVPQLLTREIAGYLHTRSWGLYRGIELFVWRWVVVISALILTIYFLLVLVTDWIPASGKWSLLGLAVLLVPLRGASSIQLGRIRGLGKPALSDLFGLLINPFIVLFVILALHFSGKLTLWNAVLVQIFAATTALIITGLIYKHIRPPKLLASSPRLDAGAWSKSLVSLAMLGALSTMNAQLGLVLLGFLGTDESVAALRVAERAAYFVGLPLGIVNLVISPYIVKIFKDGETLKLQSLLRQSARGALCMSAALAIVIIFFGKTIITIVFGLEFVGIAYQSMIVMICGQVFNVYVGSVGVILVMTGNEQWALGGNILGFLVTLVLGAILVPELNQLGMAIAVSGGLICWNLLLAFGVSYRLGIRAGPI